jgi:hypothetical protein
MMTAGVLLALAAVGCSNAFDLPRGTPHMSGTWIGTAPSVAITVILGSVQPCSGFCVANSGPITGGSYKDTTLGAHGGTTGFYTVNSYGSPTDITDWDLVLYPNVSDTTSFFTFGGSFTSATTVVGKAYFTSAAGEDSVAITLVKQ